jgi:hypothetical protein
MFNGNLFVIVSAALNNSGDGGGKNNKNKHLILTPSIIDDQRPKEL